MSPREAGYAVLAAGGLVSTSYFNVRYLAEGGRATDVAGAMRIAFANPLTSSFTIDLLIAFATFVVWSWLEARRLGMRAGWVYGILGLLTAFAFAFPFFLFMRERALRRGEP